jgi:hypothetical protein
MAKPFMNVERDSKNSWWLQIMGRLKPRVSLEQAQASVDSLAGSVASFGLEQGFKERASFPGTLGSHFEEFVDEPILTPDATPAQPPHLALPNYVHRLIALNRSSRSLEFAKPLLSVHSPFDRAMVLLDDVVQILDGSVAAPAAEYPFLLYVCDGRTVDRRQIRVDDAGLRMR